MARNEDREPPVLEDRERRNLVAALGALGALGATLLANCVGSVGSEPANEANLDETADALRGSASILFCDTIGEHRTLQGGTTATSTNVVVRRGYATPADGGGGLFVWTPDTTTPQSVDPRGGTLVVPRGLPRTGCWKRVYSGPLNVRWFGAVGNGAVDDSGAIQATIDALPINGSSSLPTGQVYFPTGSYLVSETLRITQDRTHLFGDGLYATQIFFSPASTPELFKLEKPGAELVQCTVREMSFLGQSAAQKIAISATDTSDLLIERVSTLYWTGGGSIGIQLRGREATTVRKVSLSADRPITIEPNPNSTIDADHYHFEDLFLSIPVIDSPDACVTIEGATASSPTGVNVSNLTFDGTNSFNGGKYGLYWKDTVAPQPQAMSIYLRLRNIRHEQASIGQDGWSIYIDHQVTDLLVEGVSAATEVNGFYFRQVSNLTMINCDYVNTAMTALDIDASCGAVALMNVFFQLGSVVNATGMDQALSFFQQPNAMAPAFGFYQAPLAGTTAMPRTVRIFGQGHGSSDTGSAPTIPYGWINGDIVWNKLADTGQPIGWIYTPGGWKSFGMVS